NRSRLADTHLEFDAIRNGGPTPTIDLGIGAHIEGGSFSGDDPPLNRSFPELPRPIKSFY
ncbi:hypothetical protein LINGRAHAP2_LOCUS37414, partial [Linum grandiflorum]